MKQHQTTIAVRTGKPGLIEITDQVARVVSASGIQTGICHVFVRHTSASLVIQENADPTARQDIENYFRKLAPEGDPEYTHTLEGPDDIPAHLRAALTSTSELIPIVSGRLGLGTWQGLYLFEHRRRPASRNLIVHVWGET